MKKKMKIAALLLVVALLGVGVFAVSKQIESADEPKKEEAAAPVAETPADADAGVEAPAAEAPVLAPN